jgi:mono/diheme cytochrome c family protein
MTMNQKHSCAILVVLLAMVFATSARAESPDAREGQKYFLRYCASCHGTSGAGDGPVAKSLAKTPANLRLLAEQYGLPLPAAKLAQIIDGRDAVRAHGTPAMPVWGEKLYAAGEGERGEVGVSEVLRKIVAYLDTIQDHRHAMR